MPRDINDLVTITLPAYMWNNALKVLRKKGPYEIVAPIIATISMQGNAQPANGPAPEPARPEPEAVPPSRSRRQVNA